MTSIIPPSTRGIETEQPSRFSFATTLLRGVLVDQRPRFIKQSLALDALAVSFLDPVRDHRLRGGFPLIDLLGTECNDVVLAGYSKFAAWCIVMFLRLAKQCRYVLARVGIDHLLEVIRQAVIFCL